MSDQGLDRSSSLMLILKTTDANMHMDTAQSVPERKTSGYFQILENRNNRALYACYVVVCDSDYCLTQSLIMRASPTIPEFTSIILRNSFIVQIEHHARVSRF